jgi:serine/threonine protein kinase
MLFIEQGKDYDDVDEAQLPYTHVQNLGHGHSGNVEEVIDRHTNKIYARKTIRIPPSKANKAERTKVFHNEVTIIRGLSKHRHIVSVFATYVTRRHFGIVLQPVASDGDLEHFLADYWNNIHDSNDSDSSTRCTTTMAAILEQGFGCLAAGLAFMHEKKIRHKDIKPHNILVHKSRMIYTDFGYSFDSTGFSRSTTFGTPSAFTRKYSAPEVLDYDNRNSKSDVFSLGCVFIEMLFALTLTLHQEITSFAATMDVLHAQIAGLMVSPSVATVPAVIVKMTVGEASERQSAYQSTVMILESPGSCCSDCKAMSREYQKLVVHHDQCSDTRISALKHEDLPAVATIAMNDLAVQNDEAMLKPICITTPTSRGDTSTGKS